MHVSQYDEPMQAVSDHNGTRCQKASVYIALITIIIANFCENISIHTLITLTCVVLLLVYEQSRSRR